MKIFLSTILLVIFLSGSVFANDAPNYLYLINQKVCSRFEDDLAKMAAIVEEVKRRKGITETRVAFGGVDTPIKVADYQITYAAEAIAFQRAQKFSYKNELKSSLEVLKNKILQAKNEVGKVLTYEK